jgi:hypothetical protein
LIHSLGGGGEHKLEGDAGIPADGPEDLGRDTRRLAAALILEGGPVRLVKTFTTGADAR